MPSRLDAAPKPAELAVWMQVASPATARGVFRRNPVDPSAAVDFAWVGSPPAPVWCPPGEPVRFWHAAPDRWRLESAGQALGICDGTRAVAWGVGGVRHGLTLLQPFGPAALLYPSSGSLLPGLYQDFLPSGGHVAGGTVQPAELLDRPCWAWTIATPGSTGRWWLDEASGCALRLETPAGSLELLEFEDDVAVDDALFRLAPEPEHAPEQEPAVWTRRGSLRTPPDAEPAGPGGGQDTADFTVTWWPFGALSHPIAGDPDVPEVLLVLDTGQDRPAFFLGVAPSGRRAPARQRAQVRRWDGDGWTFALSWLGDVADEDLDRIVASVPRSWA